MTMKRIRGDPVVGYVVHFCGSHQGGKLTSEYLISERLSSVLKRCFCCHRYIAVVMVIAKLPIHLSSTALRSLFISSFVDYWVQNVFAFFYIAQRFALSHLGTSALEKTPSVQFPIPTHGANKYHTSSTCRESDPSV